MHILFTRFPYESSPGGAENQTIAQMVGLRAKGHTVHFMGSCLVLLAWCRERGIACTEVHIGKPPVSKWAVVNFFVSQLAMAKQLKREYRRLSSKQTFDAVCMLSLSEKILLTKELVDYGVKVLWVEHDRVGRWLSSNPWLKRLKALSKRVTTVCVSELSRQLYLAMGWPEGNVIAIPNGIDTKRITGNTTTVPMTATPETLEIGCISRLTTDKGVDVLIDAVAKLPNTTLTIVGRGTGEHETREQIKRLKLENRVQLVTDFIDLAAFYEAIEVLVLPSRENDPFGLVAAEAMLMTTPVIVTDQCGIAGYLKDGHDALIVKAGSSSALVPALKKMSDDSVRATLAKNGKKTADTQFGVDTMVDRYEAVMLQE